jgi:hypothetical protein
MVVPSSYEYLVVVVVVVVVLGVSALHGAFISSIASVLDSHDNRSCRVGRWIVDFFFVWFRSADLFFIFDFLVLGFGGTN